MTMIMLGEYDVYSSADIKSTTTEKLPQNVFGPIERQCLRQTQWYFAPQHEDSHVDAAVESYVHI